MSEAVKERKDMDPAYMWDLTLMYADDEAWEKELADMDERTAALSMYSGRLHDAETVYAFLKDINETSRRLSNLFTYANLRYCEDTRDPAGQTMYAKAYAKYTVFASAASFAEPEFLSLDDETISRIVSDARLSAYSCYFENLLRRRPHTLSAKEEKLLADMAECTGASAQTAQALMNADLCYPPVADADGNMHDLEDSVFILYQESNDRVLRENAFRAYYDIYKKHINTFASTYNGTLKGMTAEAKLRGYASSRAMALAQENIPETVYDSLIDAVHGHMDTMYRYLKLRKRMLKLDELHYYDLYAPLVSSDTDRYTYEQAQEIVLDALSVLGEDYCNTVRRAFSERWIDVLPNKGKQGGAFSGGSYDSAPYILLNYTGTLDSVSTIAHEMGHSMHSWNTNHFQPYHYSDYTMFVAEVASTVNENLLIEKLLKEENDPAKRLVLLNQYLEGFKGTVYRQTMFCEFEKKAHALCEQRVPLNAEMLCDLYMSLVREYFGDDFEYDEEVRYEWSRIPHFYMPFYVYVYATGYCSAAAISQKIMNEGESAVNDYLSFLKLGSSMPPIEELKKAGVDLSSDEPVDIALQRFASVLDEAERMADLLEL